PLRSSTATLTGAGSSSPASRLTATARQGRASCRAAFSMGAVAIRSLVTASSIRLNGSRAGLAIADLDRPLHRHDEHLAVADVALDTASRVLFQAGDRLVDEVVVHGDLELHLAEQVSLVLMPAIGLDVPALPRVPHRVEHRHPRNADVHECLLDRRQ